MFFRIAIPAETRKVSFVMQFKKFPKRQANRRSKLYLGLGDLLCLLVA